MNRELTKGAVQTGKQSPAPAQPAGRARAPDDGSGDTRQLKSSRPATCSLSTGSFIPLKHKKYQKISALGYSVDERFLRKHPCSSELSLCSQTAAFLSFRTAACSRSLSGESPGRRLLPRPSSTESPVPGQRPGVCYPGQARRGGRRVPKRAEGRSARWRGPVEARGDLRQGRRRSSCGGRIREGSRRPGRSCGRAGESRQPSAVRPAV